MLKKLVTIFMVFCTLNTYAGNNNQMFTQAFDELSYKLEVQWDQKDQAFYDQAMQDFENQLESLGAKGLSNAEMFQIAREQIKDQKVQQDFDMALMQVNINQLEGAAAKKFLIKSLKNSYKTGANYIGDGFYYGTGAVLLVALVFWWALSADCYSDWYCDPWYGCYEEVYCY